MVRRILLSIMAVILFSGCNQPNIPNNNYSNTTLEEGDTAFKEGKYEVAEIIFSKFCNSGNIEACVKQGKIYNGVSDKLRNIPKSISIFKDACDKGNTKGCLWLGNAYMSKDGNDPIKGMEYYKMSCEKGDYAGCANASFRYYTGLGIPMDIPLAIEFISKACALGDKNSCEKASRYSLNGKVTIEDKENNTKYDGYVVNGKYEGKGILTYTNNGDKYEGDFKNNKFNGKGIYNFYDGSKYEGEWKDSTKDGFGILILPANNKNISGWAKTNSGSYVGEVYVVKGKWSNDKLINSSELPAELLNWMDGNCKSDFENAKKSKNILLLTEFLKKYPLSSYKSQIVAQLDTLIEPEYQKVVKSKDIDSLQSFANKYPSSSKSKDALNLIEQIKQKDKSTYDVASSINTLNTGMISKNGIAKDSATGLEWQDEPYTQAEKTAYDKKTNSGKAGNWNYAKAYCENLTLGGKSDWRLPNIYELTTLIDETKSSEPYIINGFDNVLSDNYWSSTTLEANSSLAWYVGFYTAIDYMMDKTNSSYVRCVRAEQLNFDNLVILKNKAKLKVSQKEIDRISPKEEARITMETYERERQAKTTTTRSYNSWEKSFSRYDRTGVFPSTIHGIRCDNGKSNNVIETHRDTLKRFSVWENGYEKGEFETLSKAANYICGN